MESILFPTTIVDNFLQEAEEYVKLSTTLNFYSDKQGKWPGTRSEDLSIKYPNMMNRIITKILSIYYDFDSTVVMWNSKSFFQKVSSNHKVGWIHRDPNMLTAIIYFCDEGLGTSLYKIKDVSNFYDVLNTDQKVDSFLNVNKLEEFEKFKNENNSLFEKSITVDSKFNRLFCFEGMNIHGADNFINNDKNKERLTLITFISSVATNNFPIQRSKFI